MHSLRASAVAVIVAMQLSAPIDVLAQRPETRPDTSGVREVVQRYLHGLKYNDTTSLKRAFWPEARLMFLTKDGALGQLTQPDWYRTFAGSVGKEEPGELEIVTIDVTGDAASVKVVETYPRSLYVDYLNLLRLGGEWRIVNKIYTRRAR